MTALTDVDTLADRLSRVSARAAWDVERAFDWPERLDPRRWCMSPELVSIHGTDLWHELSAEQQRHLSFLEVVNFFSVVLHGEKPLVSGIRDVAARTEPGPVADYLEHFEAEETRHMAMFARFCTRYAGRVFPDKTVAFEREYEPGMQEVEFFCKVLVVEELGDFYNRTMMRDARIEPIVRELNRAHHVDEARHLLFGRAHLHSLFEQWSPRWSAASLDGLREWLVGYLRLSWAAYYNPTVYAEVGFGNGFAARAEAIAAASSAAHRRAASQRLLQFLADCGILREAVQP